MPDILRRICAVKRREINDLRRHGEVTLRARMDGQSAPRGFRAAMLARGGVALIAEIKKASPSAGIIRDDFDPAAVARAYEQGGARSLSVLTDVQFFQGRLEDMAAARAAASLPVMRKDFILDAIQMLESRAWGADCVLLIVACLEQDKLAALMKAARDLGMDALVEVHTREELDVALSVEADLIGINNRDLRTFKVDLETACTLAPLVPKDVVVVAESGIKTRADVVRLKECGVRAILVGESLMRAADIAAATRELSDV
jgi:indole-3-glycerol phosphate synthase